MKKIALIGNPVSHSLSPLLFSLAYGGNGAQINGQRYMYEIVESSSMEDAFAKISSGEYIGANVTAPYKELVMKYVTHPSSVSEIIGAANLLLFKDGQVHSFNTDYEAALRFAKSFGESASFYIAGCGGAGKASALACCNALKSLGREPSVVIANRTLSCAKDYAERLKESVGAESEAVSLNELGSLFSSDSSRVKVLFYTLPCDIGMKERIAQGNRKDEKIIVVEPNYLNPAWKKKNGIVYISGLEWLIEQAVYGFEIFTGVKPSRNKMLSIAEFEKKK